jgi:uncharacterized protein (TIGR02284 family)
MFSTSSGENPAKPSQQSGIQCAEDHMNEKNTLSVIEDLIETCKDGQKGYQDAASHVKRPDLKTYFNEQSLERSRFAGELQAELPRLGEPDKKVSGSVSAALHRAWIDTKVSLGAGDKAILESVEAGEDNAKEAYQKALSGSLPTNVAEIIRSQAASVQKAHDKVRMLRDNAAAAA